jgi:erythromycin esterase
VLLAIYLVQPGWVRPIQSLDATGHADLQYLRPILEDVRIVQLAISPTAEVFPGVRARSMGSWVRERYGQQVYTIGQYEVTGEVADNSCKPYTIGAPPEGSLERRLDSGVPLSFIDLRTASQQRDGGWLAQPVRARYNGQHPELIVPVNQFDGLLIIARVSPPKYLY